MKFRVLPLVFLLCSCTSGTPAPTTVETMAPPTTVPDTTSSTTSTTAPPLPCPPAPYELGVLPLAVVPAAGDVEAEPDEFSSIGGTNSTLWVGSDDNVAIALIRGTLPPQEFPAEKGEVEVAGTRAVAGPYPDGRWVIAWFNEPGDRCDQYTMVFYPPVSPDEVQSTLAAMSRVAG